jgi:hypothetical protein
VQASLLLSPLPSALRILQHLPSPCNKGQFLKLSAGTSDTSISIAFGIISVCISLIGVWISYLTLRAMCLDGASISSRFLFVNIATLRKVLLWTFWSDFMLAHS